MSDTDLLWVCERCEITPKKRGDTMCPCPRGGCEAEQVPVPQKMFTRREVSKLINKHLDYATHGYTELISHFS